MTRLLAVLDVFLATVFVIVAPQVALTAARHGVLVYSYTTVFPS